jgi:Na+/H+ antiporter NhaD/arsenite permease-like protein
MLVLIAGLSATSVFDPDFRWLAGTFTLAVAGAGLAWFRLRARWGRMRALIRTLEWDTALFLVGVFVLVGAVGKSGWLEAMARWVSVAAGNSPLRAYLLIVGLAVLVSAFVDNVPFLLAMIPVTQSVATRLGVEVPLLLFGLLVGACLGGNITPIGASANIVAMGMLRKSGYQVSFREFMAVGIPFTLAAVVVASVFVWMIWG